jgi:hypothetical protein
MMGYFKEEIMKKQLLLEGEDTLFHSREMSESQNITHVNSNREALSLIGGFDFDAIVARDGHIFPEDSDSQKIEMLASLIERNHNTGCR